FQIKFYVDVQVGSSVKKVAVEVAKSLSVTCVVLERQMKKDRKYFMEKLTCGILRMKRDGTIEKLRGLITIDDKKQKLVKRTASSDHVSHVTYGEMIPVMSKQELSQKKTSNAQKATTLHKPEGGYSCYRSSASMVSTSSFTTSDVSSASIISTTSFTASEVSSCTDARNLSTADEYFKNTQPTNIILESKHQTDVESFDEEGVQEQDGFEYSVCSVCENKRPNVRLKQDFTYAELLQATNGFSEEKYLSEGGFGSVYEGTLRCGLKVAVKQHKDVSSQGEKEFKSEVKVLSKARHENLVMLLGSCSEGTHRLLVYEFVCNGSLDQHLSSKNCHELTWDKRIKIALGAARGLDYLHSINIIHRDMRPNNILVTHDYKALLGDFGLARTVCVDTDETGVVGTLGYVAPEYAECGKVSTKTDVYSFGVVLLQLITGCRTRDDKFGDKTLVEWARPLLEDKNYPLLIDEKILDSHDVHVFQLYLMVKLAEGCLKKDHAKRETMEDVSFDVTRFLIMIKFSINYVVQELECIKNGTTRYVEAKQC
ncbi:putative serine/threonine-protein kinase PBL21, partial [Bidens hawaiensis]|uniref:putative serine/threonine-protein kinase PBL21 n=1 Tax=Bidens hawaiensis TaxID=980011 RepID=UPI004049CC2A